MTNADLPRGFTRLWLGSAASHIGSTNTAIALPLLALSFSHSPVFAGWVTAVRTFPTLLLYLPAGMVVDRFDRRLVMLASQCTRLAIALVLTVGLFTLSDPAILLLLAAAADGILVALYNLAEVSFARQITSPEALADAMARLEARNHMAQLLGRPLGGILYGVGRSFPFIAYAVSSLLSVLLLRNVAPKKTARAPDVPSRTDVGLRECLRELLGNRFLRLALLVCTTTNFFFQIIFLMLLMQTEHRFGSSSLIGFLFITSGIGGTLGAIAAPRLVRRGRQLQTIFFCVWGWVAMTMSIWFLDDPVLGLIAWGGISFIGAHVNVALTVCQSTSIPSEMQARVTSINSFVTRSAVPLGSLFSGYVLSVMSTTRGTSALVLGATLVVALCVTAYGGKRRRRQLAHYARQSLGWLLHRFRTFLTQRSSRSSAYHMPTDGGANAVRHPRG